MMRARTIATGAGITGNADRSAGADTQSDTGGASEDLRRPACAQQRFFVTAVPPAMESAKLVANKQFDSVTGLFRRSE